MTKIEAIASDGKDSPEDSMVSTGLLLWTGAYFLLKLEAILEIVR
jgi:hypothetical protein